VAPNIWATAPIIFLNKSTGYESVYMFFILAITACTIT